MNRPAKPPSPDHRIVRAMRWAQVNLLRAAHWIVDIAGISAPVERAAECVLTPFLKKMTKLVFTLILLKAWALIPRWSARQAGPPNRARNPVMRTLIGSHLRNLSKARDVRARIAALARMLNQIDTLAARLAKRLAHGLTRRRGGFKIELHAELWALPFAAPLASADTS